MAREARISWKSKYKRSKTGKGETKLKYTNGRLYLIGNMYENGMKERMKEREYNNLKE
jgi:hypothetical protein